MKRYITCHLPVWDGPYKMTCNRQMVDGVCPTHFSWTVADELADRLTRAAPSLPPQETEQ